MKRQPTELSINVGDTNLCVWHWKGEGTPILMLHATGFHGRIWDAVIDELPNNPVYAVDLRFHGKSGKAGDVRWPLMAADIERLVETLDLSAMIGVAHSIGGYLLTIAAANAGSRFEELLLLDPVILSRQRYVMANQFEAAIDPVDHPGAKRRNAWQGPEEMIERFRARRPFDTWQKRVLEDYCAYALDKPDAQGVRKLCCDPLHETQIYLRHDGDAIYDALARLDVPTKVLRAREPEDQDNPLTDFSVSPTWPDVASLMKQGTDVYLPELTHFIPMEAPSVVAEYIREALTRTR